MSRTRTTGPKLLTDPKTAQAAVAASHDSALAAAEAAGALPSRSREDLARLHRAATTGAGEATLAVQARGLVHPRPPSG